MALKVSTYGVNRYIAPSGRGVIGARPRDLVLDEGGLLEGFVLHSMLHGPADTPAWRLAFNLLRCVQAAASSYREGRAILLQVTSDNFGLGTDYFLALRQFENCVDALLQCLRALARSAGAGTKYGNVANLGQLIGDIRNDFEHMDERVANGATHLAVWMTTDGLESARAKLSFEDLADAIEGLGEFGLRLYS